MNHTLQIFRKDVRHLWPQILVTLALFLTFDIFEIVSSPLQTPEAQRIVTFSLMVELLLTLAIWYLVALAVYQEPLPGDRQFWLTKPYSRGKLLAAKVLFIFVCINVPLFLSDCFILGAQGFPLLSSFPQLLLRQLLLTTFFILPSFAIATVTRGAAQFVFAWFLILLSFIAEVMLLDALYRTHGAVSVFQLRALPLNLFLAAIAVATIVWQYAKRQTIAGRVALIVVAFIGLPATSEILNWAQYLPGSHRAETRSTGPANIHIAYELGRKDRNTSVSPGYYVTVGLPIQVEGLPPDTLLQGVGLATIEVGGKVWPKSSSYASSIERLKGEYWQKINVETSIFDASKNRTVNLQAPLHLTLLTDRIQTRIPVTETSFWVPHLGRCYSALIPELMELQLACRSGPSAVPMSVRVDDDLEQPARADFETPPSLPSGLSPFSETITVGSGANLKPNATFDFTPRRKIVSFDRTLYLQNVQLTDYGGLLIPK